MCNKGLGVAEVQHEHSLCQTELDLTEQIDNYGVQINVDSLLPFSHSVQARWFIEKNQKYEILGIWREQWINLRLSVPLLPALQWADWNLGCCSQSWGLKWATGGSCELSKNWVKAFVRCLRVLINLLNHCSLSQSDAPTALLWPAKLYRGAEDQTHPEQCSWAQRSRALSRSGKVCVAWLWM